MHHCCMLRGVGGREGNSLEDLLFYKIKGNYKPMLHYHFKKDKKKCI